MVEGEGLDIAVIGLQCRVPGAKDLDSFWQNLQQGKESVRFFSEAELLEAGQDPELLQHPKYVKASPTLENFDCFDAPFFGYSPREAAVMDPQQRLMLEAAWNTLEHAGYTSENYSGRIGIFAGSAMNTYLLSNGLAPRFYEDYLPTLIGNDKDFLATRVAYKLNLSGPAVCVQTACSSSLVAIHLASQSLLNGECEMCLAGGVSIRIPQISGYLYEEGSVLSPDGHCRPFDAKAQGTIFGSGIGMVLLKSLEDALEDGDKIYAIIRGSAINNDGSSKVDYTAPSVTSQSEVIVEALSAADIKPESISYVEAHGTGTYLGDPIEIAALTKAYRNYSEKNGFCKIGSVKSNLGHLDAAAGVVGLIKTVLALENEEIPASINFEKPNPQIEFEKTPFQINDKLSPWPRTNQPRRAAITSLGIGGTNAHIILEEGPKREQKDSEETVQILSLSAASQAALQSREHELADYLETNPSSSLSEVANSLQLGRKALGQRSSLVGGNKQELINRLRGQGEPPLRRQTANKTPSLALLFPGNGAQHPDMGLDLYQKYPIFKTELDKCCEILDGHLNEDLKEILYGKAPREERAQKLSRPSLSMPALFAVEYSLSKLLLSWKLEPSALLGHSVGEYVAATIAGVFNLEDGLRIISKRGSLCERVSGGAMLSVALGETELAELLPEGLNIAALNAPNLCSVSGEAEEIERFEKLLQKKKIESRRLHVKVAFHSKALDPILDEFEAELNKCRLSDPEIPLLSNLSGTWAEPGQLSTARYWRQHLRKSVRYADCVQALLKDPNRVYLEVGPGTGLGSLLRQQLETGGEADVINSMRHPKEEIADQNQLLVALSRLWLANLKLNWEKIQTNENTRRATIPVYPFEAHRYWISAEQNNNQAKVSSDPKNWLWEPSWSQIPWPNSSHLEDNGKWLIFADLSELSEELSSQLKKQNQIVISVKQGDRLAELSPGNWSLDPKDETQFETLLKTLKEREQFPQNVLYLWPQSAAANDTREDCFFSALALAKAVSLSPVSSLGFISNSAFQVFGTEELSPTQALISGPALVLAKEQPEIASYQVDLDSNCQNPASRLIAEAIKQATDKTSPNLLAYRGSYRWSRSAQPISPPETNFSFRQDGVYLISGGLGGIGLKLAGHLAEKTKAKLLLLSRTGKSSNPAQLDALKEKNPQIIPLAVDICSNQQLEKLKVTIEQEHGQLNGIIHAAGVLDDQIIPEKTRASADSVLQPKTKGTQLLLKHFANQTLDFFLLFSSVHSLNPPAGQVDYAAANAYLDAFAQKESRNTAYLKSINWAGWQDTGMTHGLENTGSPRFLKPQDAILALEAALGSPQAQILISAYDPFQENIFSGQPEIIATQAEAPESITQEIESPQSELEQILAQIWSELLGVKEIDRNAHFLELGGHSLLATRIISRLRDQLDIELSIKDFFGAPTIAQLAEKVEEVILSELEPDQEK